VVVVDDVVTTGSTMRAAVAALLAVGYGVVSCLSVAMVE
jgi:predicted amidophosphoribosyltransferase